MGGSPLRVTHLTERAQALLDHGTLTVSDAVTAELAERLLNSGVAEVVPDQMNRVDLDHLTCVVPVRDRSQSLDRLLGGLDGVQTIVVDDASDDPHSVADVVSRHGANLISLPVNLGPAGARNVGLRAATTPYVLFVDSDVVLDIATVVGLLAHFVDPGLAAVAPRVRGLASDRSWIGRFEQVRSSLDVGTTPGLVRAGTLVGWVPSAVLAVRTAAIGRGFDDQLRVGEDVDLVWRLDDEGWRVRYDARLDARHESLTRLRPWLARKAAYGSGAAPLATRHGSKIAPAAMSVSGVLIAIALLAQRRWSVPLAGAVSAVMAARTVRMVARSDRPYRLSAELTAEGVSSIVSQIGQLLLRHWWPAVAVAALFSSRIRRAVLVAAVAHTVIDHRRTDPDLNVISYGVARALDNLAYGAGVWAGAWRARSPIALIPRLSGAGRGCRSK